MANSSSKLRGKVILVTGAAKRIGRAISIALAREGAKVAIHYHESEDAARLTAAECQHAPIFPADLTKVSEIERLYSEVHEHFGRIDGVVNNAARFTHIPPMEITEEDWDSIHSVNLKAVFFSCQQAARHMTSGGHIVNISSLGGIRPWANHAHYCASKAGVIMLTECLAKAFAPAIAVNSVAPGLFPFGHSDERIRRMVEATPAGRTGEAEEVVEAVLFLLTATNFITGQTIAVDGGLSLR